MEEYSLIAHPGAPAGAAQSITVHAERAGSLLRLRYEVTEDIEAIIWPGASTPGMADALWQHSCFEAFLSAPGSAAYAELNLSPSGKWAIYAFDKRRSGMRPAEGLTLNTLEFTRAQAGAALSATVDLGTCGGLNAGFAAVIEQASGKTYWALAHAPGPPDFHDPACFTARLSPPVIR